MFCFHAGHGAHAHKHDAKKTELKPVVAQARGGMPCGGRFRERFQQQKEANQFSILLELLQNGNTIERTAASSAIKTVLSERDKNVLCDLVKELAETRNPRAWQFMRDAARARGGAVAHKVMWQSEKVKDSSNEHEINSFQESRLRNESRETRERFEGFRQSMAEQRANAQTMQQPSPVHRPHESQHRHSEKAHQKMREAPESQVRILPSIISMSKQAAAALWKNKEHKKAEEEPKAPEGAAAQDRVGQKSEELPKKKSAKAGEGKAKMPKPSQKPPAAKEKKGKAKGPAHKGGEKQDKRRKKGKAQKQIENKRENQERKKRKVSNAKQAAKTKAKAGEKKPGKRESTHNPAQKNRKKKMAGGRKKEAEKQKQRKKSRTLSEFVKKLLEKKKARRKRKWKPPVLARGPPDDDKGKRTRRRRGRKAKKKQKAVS